MLPSFKVLPADFSKQEISTLRLQLKHYELDVENIFGENRNFHENPCKLRQKICLNSPKNHTCRWYDYTQHCKNLIQTQLCLWDIKITNFKLENYPDDLLEICYFYMLQTKSSLNKIFYKVVHHHIIYMCNFFDEFRRLFWRGLHGFSRSYGLHYICSLI